MSSRNDAAGPSKRPRYDMVPSYKQHQLLGDSLFVRFSEQLLQYKPAVTYAGNSRSRGIGYCTGGQTISQLRCRLEAEELPLGPRVMVMIGTNDLLRKNTIETMMAEYRELTSLLCRRTERMVLVTIPPILLHADDAGHIPRLQRCNEFICGLANGDNIVVVDAAVRYLGYNNCILPKYYEQHYNKGGRVDRIHLNRLGLKLLKSTIDLEYFDGR